MSDFLMVQSIYREKMCCQIPQNAEIGIPEHILGVIDTLGL